MGNGLMPPDDKVHVALGLLQGQITSLSEKFDDFNERTVEEQRKVHQIVDATAESIRNVSRIVDEMKPLVDAYRLKQASLDEAVELTDDYREQRAEKRGQDKLKKWLYGLAASVGGLIAVLVGKLFDWLMRHPPVPVAAIIILTLAIAASGRAFGQHNHAHHHAFYQNWINKDDKGCCNDHDCGELADSDERTDGGVLRVKVDGEWCPVLQHHYLKRGNVPNASVAHVCVSKYAPEGTPACQKLLCYQPKPGS